MTCAKYLFIYPKFKVNHQIKKMTKYLCLFIFTLASGVILYSCGRKVEKVFLKKLVPIPAEYDDITLTGLPNQGTKRSACRSKMNYVPNPEHLDHTPIKTIRVNFHIMRNGNGEGNFPDKNQGRIYVKKILQSTNQKLQQNAKMFLPLKNEIPNLPMCYRFELTPNTGVPNDDGIYFHDDDELYHMTNYGANSNIYSKDVYKKYGIKKDSIMNIFLMGFHVDSVASKTYKMSSNGVAFGKWTKIASWYYFMDATKWETAEEIPFLDHWNSQRLLNHELGHCLGLRHSWGRNDGCDDTPAHSNCWNYTQNGSDCDSLVSNNIMDYNAHAGAWTPCQIATVHYNLSNKKYRVRSLLKKTWCHYDTSKTIRIQKGEDINWNSAKDLEGDIIIEDGGSLTIRCRVSIPPNGRIIVKSQAKLILDGATLENDCGKSWKGIEVWKSKKMKGEVVMINDAKITEIENPIEVSAE
jgi:hypothetical protein